jgi:uncharacterized membrane protein
MNQLYLTLKSLHVLGVVMFIGNIMVTAWWKVMADRTRDPRIIAFAQRQVTLTDYVFTGGGVALIAATGYGAAVLHGMNIVEIRWLAWGNALFIASGIIWFLILIPVQARLARIAREFAVSDVIPGSYWQLERIWAVAGSIAVVLPLINLYWMVFKPT